MTSVVALGAGFRNVLIACSSAEAELNELVALVRAGTTPLEALQASTRNAAEFVGLRAMSPYRGRRSIGTMVGDEPAWMLPRTSNPCRSYNGTLRGFDDSRYARALSRSTWTSAWRSSADP
jgi:hypothetical protein